MHAALHAVACVHMQAALNTTLAHERRDCCAGELEFSACMQTYAETGSGEFDNERKQFAATKAICSKHFRLSQWFD